MASKQRARAPKKERKPNQLAELGIFEIPDLDTMDNDMEDDDENDLESELEAILSGKTGSKPARPKKKVADLDLEEMAAECMKDDFSDENSDGDENITDPDLLKELEGLSIESPAREEIGIDKQQTAEKDKDLPSPGVASEKSPESVLQMLQERLQSYKTALCAAKSLGDNSKVRRYGRGVKSLEELIKSAKSGKHFELEDIPPVVSIPKGKTSLPEAPHATVDPPPGKEASEVPALSITDNLIDISFETENVSTEREEREKNDECLTILINRRQKYKIAALQAKKDGDKTTALEYMKILKTFDAVIEKSLKYNELVDISKVPPSPPLSPALHYKVSPPDPSKLEHEETQTSSIEAAALSAASEPEDPTLFAAPPAPKSILEALEQRLEKFTSTKSAAETEGNLSKARRLMRIVKLYEKAIKDYKAGKTIDFEELPAPPGFAPIPVPTESGVFPLSKIEAPSKPPGESVVPPPKRAAPEVPSRNVEPRKPKVQRTNTLGDKQLDFLLERQRLFREAAISSKKAGHIPQAKDYLRMSKGFDSMIEATKCGLPIDLSSIPTPPQLAISSSEDFVIVDRFECHDVGSDSDLFEILHKDLTRQIELCKDNKERYLKLGDVSSASKFEKLGLESQKDLSIVFHMRKAGQVPPKFHYETRMFNIVSCNSDLADNELEVTVERGINLPGKAHDLDSYVRLEFPIPNSDEPKKAKTNVVRDTNNPIFQEEFKFNFNRKSRAQLRQFKRQSLKLEVLSRGGFLRSDSLLGTTSIKLVDLETACTIHDSFELMDGRKTTGGKVECKLRIKQPLLVNKVEQVREKWLVIGS